MKKHLLWLAALAMTFSFTACGDDNDDPKTQKTEAEIIAEIDQEDNVDYTSSNSTAWRTYMRIVSNLLVTDATTLYNDWTVSFNGGAPYGEQFKNHQISGIETGLAGVEELIDFMADIANEVGESKIGDPLTLYTTNWMNKANMREGLYAVESWYSWHSRLDYANNILSIRNAYYGVYDKSINNRSQTPAEHSMYNTVNAINPTLNTKMVNAIDQAITDIMAIPQPFRNNINTTESRTAQATCATLVTDLTQDLKNFFQTSANTDEVCDPIVANVVDNVIIPTYKDLKDLNTALNDAVVAFYNNPSNAGFEACAEAWVAARQPWESSEAFLFGPVADKGLDPNMDSWPLDRSGILNILNNQDFSKLNWDGDFDEDDSNITAAQNLRGFHTLEFLIYKNGQARKVN